MGKLMDRKKTKLVNFLMLLSILLCIGCAIWSRENIKWLLSALYMSALRYWFYKPRSVIGEELDGPF